MIKQVAPAEAAAPTEDRVLAEVKYPNPTMQDALFVRIRLLHDEATQKNFMQELEK